MGTVVNNQITYGSKYVFDSGNTHGSAVAIVATNTLVVAYTDDDNSDKGTAVIGTISGNAITFGGEHVFNNLETGPMSVDQVLAIKFVIAYQDTGNSNHGVAQICSNSGAVISCGSKYTFNAATTSYVSVRVLKGASPDAFIVAFRDLSDSSRGKAMIGQISGTAITFGSETTFNNSTTGHISLADLTSTQAAIAYRDEGNSNYGTARIATVSGTTIAFGTEYVFNNAYTEVSTSFGIARLSDTKFALAYTDEDGVAGSGRVGQVSGTVIAFDPAELIIPGSDSDDPVVDAITGGYVVCWADLSSSYRGKCRVNGDALIFFPLVSK